MNYKIYKLSFCLFFLFLGVQNAVSQNKNHPHEFNFQQRLSKELLHTSLRPYNENFYLSKNKQFDKVLYGNDTIEDKKWIIKKLFNESFLDVKEGDVHLQFDPLFNLSVGNRNITDEYRIFYNTRGFRVMGDLGKKISFGTRFYENQFNYPDYLDAIADEKGVAIGFGRSKAFKSFGHDAGLSSGYISYSPTSKINLQFGHGRHFFGSGYRSLLLSDYAPDYPYFSGQYSFFNGKLNYKHVTAWIHTLDRRPVASNPITSESLFKQKGGTFNMISFQPNQQLQMSVFEGSIHKRYDEETGSISPGVSFYIPLFGLPSMLNDSSTGINRVYGYNISLRMLKNLELYGQGMIQNALKWGVQLGAKYFEPLQIKNSFVLIEFNHIEPYSYTTDSSRLIQSYSHNKHELAHPLGAGIDEIIIKSHFEKARWFANFQFSWIMRTREVNSNLGTSIFLPDNNLSNALIQEKWMYGLLEFGYLLNNQSRMQLYTGLYLRGVGFSENYFLLGIRTNLVNRYFDQ